MHQEIQLEINQGELLKDLVYIAVTACQIVHDFQNNTAYKKYQKKPNDLVTDADYKIQTMIINSIREKYPNLKIVGEETHEFQGEIQVDHQKFLNQLIEAQMKIDQSARVEDLCIWIDPIDSTSSFVKGNLHYVTVLIGVTLKERPLLGVIGIPYEKIKNQQVYSPSVVFGSVEKKFVKSYTFINQQIEQLNLTPLNKPLVMLAGCSTSKGITSYLRHKLEAHEKRVSGAGFRMMGLIQGHADFLVFQNGWSSRWDICACEALVIALGGLMSDTKGQEIIYRIEQNRSYDNEFGVLAAMNKQVFAEIKKGSRQYHQY